MKRSTNGTKDAISRYSNLQMDLDRDLFNGRWHGEDTVNDNFLRPHFNFIDLFSGAGGLSLGFVQAGYKKLISNEIDPDASATIRKNFPNSVHFDKPIEEISEKDLRVAIQDRVVHVVIGGPPCQGFSVAGRRDPKDPRNKLFYEFVRIVRFTKPWFVVLENVPGILTISGGSVSKAIIEEFEDLGYRGMSVRILEAAKFGVPQLRTRAIFVGNRFGLSNPYPNNILDKKNYVPIEIAISDLKNLPRMPEINHEWTQHSKSYEKRLAKVPPGSSLYPTYRDAFKRQYLGVPCMTIKENHGGTHVHPELNRCISAREMARLQTFPDDFIFSGTMKRAMWQIGNAVPPLLAKQIALALHFSLCKIQETIDVKNDVIEETMVKA